MTKNQIRATKFFFKNLVLSVTTYHGQLSSCIISKKLMIQSWENLLTDGQSDGRTNGQTNESAFTGRCPTNVERPITLVSDGRLHVRRADKHEFIGPFRLK